MLGLAQLLPLVIDLPRLLPPDDVQTPVADDETEDSWDSRAPGPEGRLEGSWD